MREASALELSFGPRSVFVTDCYEGRGARRGAPAEARTPLVTVCYLPLERPA